MQGFFFLFFSSFFFLFFFFNLSIKQVTFFVLFDPLKINFKSFLPRIVWARTFTHTSLSLTHTLVSLIMPTIYA